jgi:hypothetical protein
LPIGQNVAQTQYFGTFWQVHDNKSAINTADGVAIELALNFFKRYQDFRNLFEFGLFQHGTDTNIAFDARSTTLLGKGKLNLGHEEVATLRADLILSFTSQSVLVVDQFASSHFEGLALTRKLNLAAIDYHLGCFRRWVKSFFSCDKFASLDHHTRLFGVGSLEFRPSLKHLEKLFSLHLCDFCFLWQGFVGGLFLSQLLRRPQRLLPGAIRMLVRILRLYNAVLLFVTFILAAFTFG